MTIEIKVPPLPESVADATVLTWHKKPGDAVKRDENLVDLETDKVVIEVPAAADGILKDIAKPNGTKVNSGELLGSIEAGKAAAVSAPAPAAKAPQKVVEKPAEKMPEQKSDVVLGPSLRRAVGTGEKSLSSVTSQSTGSRTEQRVPMSRLRARVAERLLSAQHNAAILTTFNEVNLQAIMNLRAKYKDSFEKLHGIRLGFMSFFTRAVVEALKKFPAVNASIDGSDIVYHGYYDIGVAVSTDRGLVVPVIRDADQLSLADIEKQVANYSKRARDNQLTMEEITGGTFTITNGGVFGSLLATPILNPPQSAILGMQKIQDRPIVENGQIVIRPMMYLALSYDHRMIDGKESVQFLVTVKELLEDPSRLLLEI
ncbi:MAG: 2-oxoglutarate dehydrogenase complex dihydrolipoyllysine-residue succinyltransferase [Gammaproteobacteria bacterium]|nr:2-oxoglutarate dehydrogenase complex dihydrolipoyllysine-residue succinyltransferase [Gammaproteobacteria bacterium]